MAEPKPEDIKLPTKFPDQPGREKRINMKSAYELAMERLQKESPDQSLSEEKKAELAELDNLYKSKLAEREVFLAAR